METVEHESVIDEKERIPTKKGGRLSSKPKKYKFKLQPIIIGDNALHFYKLKPGSDILEMIVSGEDFKGILENNPNLQADKTVVGNHIVEGNNIYHLNYYQFDYPIILEKAIKYKLKIYINKEHLIMFNTMNAFNKRDKINRNIIKAHLENIQILVNSLLE